MRRFERYLEAEGVKSVRLPPQSPNLNSHLERFFRSLKDECLDRMIFFGEESLSRAVRTCVATITKSEITKDWTTGHRTWERSRAHGW